MKKFLTGLLARLTSRKFLLALGTGLVFYVNKQYTELMWVVLGYLGAEGGTDAVRAYSEQKYVETVKTVNDSLFLQGDDEDIDRSSVVPGA